MEQGVPPTGILAQAQLFVEQFMQDKIEETFVFHDFEHTCNVVESVVEIGHANDLNDIDIEILQLAGWFHDTGYDQGPLGHEQRSALYAQEFLEERN